MPRYSSGGTQISLSLSLSLYLCVINSFLKQVYLKPLRNEGILTFEEIEVIFSNIEDIRELSKTMWRKVLRRVKNWKHFPPTTASSEEREKHYLSDIFIQVVRIVCVLIFILSPF